MSRRTTNTTTRRATEILDAAAHLFARRGYHGATTQDIADVLGMRQASLYYYLPSKEIALEEVCLRGVAGYLERAASIASGPASAATKLAELVRSHLEPLQDRADDVRVFLTERQHLPDSSRHRVGRLARKYERIIDGVIKAGVKSGELRMGLDTRMATLAMLGMCNAASAWYEKEPRASAERIVREFSSVLLMGTLSAPISVRTGAKR